MSTQITWNVAGMRALQRKDQLQSIVKLVEEEDPDIICLQEHKLQEGQHCTDMQASLDKILPGWKAYWSCKTFIFSFNIVLTYGKF